MNILLVIALTILIYCIRHKFITMFSVASITLLLVSANHTLFDINSTTIIKIFKATNIICNTFILLVIAYRLLEKKKSHSKTSHLSSALLLYIALTAINLSQSNTISAFLISANFYTSSVVLSNLLANTILKLSHPNPPYDYIVVLGGSLKGTELTDLIKQRMLTSFSYYRANKSTMIFSGGKTNGQIEESVAMKNFAIENKIQDDDILVEKISTNTVQNIKNVKNLLQTTDANYKNKKICVSTNSFHALRTKLICDKLGLNWQIISTNSTTTTKLNTYLIELCASVYIDLPLHIILMATITLISYRLI